MILIKNIFIVLLFSFTFQKSAMAQSLWGGENPFFSAPRQAEPRVGGNAVDPYEGIELRRLELHSVPEGDPFRNRTGYAYTLDLQVWFEDLDNPIAKCLSDAGVFPQSLLSGSQESVKAQDLPLATNNGGYEFDRGFAQRSTPQGKEYFDLSLSFPEGSDYHSAVASIRDCFPPELLSNPRSRETQLPNVIPASAPGPVVPRASEVIDI